MPMPARGARHTCTTRLGYDEYREVVRRAKQRGWSISDYLAYCVGRELRPRKQKPIGEGSGRASGRAPEALGPLLRDFDGALHE